jgi:hypothetical protein
MSLHASNGPKIPEVYGRKAHVVRLVPRLQDGAWTDAQYAWLRGPHPHRSNSGILI